MDATQFCYWLQGFLEVSDPKTISRAELTEIRHHLDLAMHGTHAPKFICFSTPSGPSSIKNEAVTENPTWKILGATGSSNTCNHPLCLCKSLSKIADEEYRPPGIPPIFTGPTEHPPTTGFDLTY